MKILSRCPSLKLETFDSRRQGGGDGGDLVRGGAVGAQGRLDRLALSKDDIPLLYQGAGAALFGLGKIGDVFRHHPHLDGAERSVDDARIAKSLSEDLRLAKSSRQHLLGGDRHGGATAGLGRDAPLLLQERQHVVIGEARRVDLDRKGREIPLDQRNVRIRYLGGGFRDADFLVVGKQAQRVEGRNIRGVSPRRQRKIGGDADELAQPDGFAVSRANGHRRLEALLCRDRRVGAVQAIGLAHGRRGLVGALRNADGVNRHAFGRQGADGGALERDIDGGADQRRPGKTRKDAGAEPAQIDVATVDLSGGAAFRVQGSLMTEVNPVGGSRILPLEASGAAVIWWRINH